MQKLVLCESLLISVPLMISSFSQSFFVRDGLWLPKQEPKTPQKLLTDTAGLPPYSKHEVKWLAQQFGGKKLNRRGGPAVSQALC